MLIALWILIGVGVAVWSLLGWGLYALLALDHQQWLGDLKPLIDQVPFGHWLERWFPGWQAVAELAIEAVQLALAWLGAAAPIVVWGVWGVGTLVLVGIGAALSLLIVLLRDKPRPVTAS
jgi:hypothetical protein